MPFVDSQVAGNRSVTVDRAASPIDWSCHSVAPREVTPSSAVPNRSPGVGVRAERRRHRALLTVALEDDLDGVAGLGLPHGRAEVAVLDLDPADRQDDVARLDARGLGAAVLGDAADLGTGTIDQLARRGEDAEQQHDGEQQVHQRSGGDHEHPPGIRLLPVGPRLVGRRHLVEVVHADDPHERSERQQAHAVLGLAAVEAPQPRPEADEELRRLHARHPGGDEVAELVEEHRHEDPEGEQQHPAVGEAEPDEQPDDRQAGDDPDGAAAERLIGRVALGDGAAGHHLAAEAVVPRAGGRRRERRLPASGRCRLVCIGCLGVYLRRQ